MEKEQIKKTKAIINGRIYFDGKIIKNKAILFRDTIIGIIKSEDIEEFNIDMVYDAENKYIFPGFIDIHTHGYKNFDVMEKNEKSIERISQAIVENGVTSFLATTMTSSEEKIKEVIQKAKQTFNKRTTGAQLLGIHLEGPYISMEYAGAHNKEYIVNPNENLLCGNEDIIKIVTIAPEIQGSMELIEKYSKKGINFSIGHSGGTYNDFIKAIEKGARGATHIFNGMRGFHHREIGIVGGALLSECYIELIADNIHVCKEAYEMILRTKSIDKLILVTDSTLATSMEDGEYSFGDNKIFVENGICKLEDNILAGSTLKLNVALSNFIKATNISINDGIKLITINPAKYLQIDNKKGSLEIGKDADIVIADENINIYKTFTKGIEVYIKDWR